jgi:putative transposase
MQRHPKLGRLAVNKEEQTRKLPCFAYLSATRRRVGWVERSETHLQRGDQQLTSYRRNLVVGGSYFFTVNLAERRRRLLTQHIEALRAAFRYARHRHPFTIDAIVVLPDYLHAIWTLPEGEADFAVRWQLIKAGFSRGLPQGEEVSPSRSRKGERGIWQRRYWEHTLRDEKDFTRHTDYIHFNPVKHGHVGRARDWPYSSFHRLARLGVYPADWAGELDERREGGFGER